VGKKILEMGRFHPNWIIIKYLCELCNKHLIVLAKLSE
jgi:hypothetical protein